MNLHELTVDEVIKINQISIQLNNTRNGTNEAHNLIRPDVLESAIGGIFIQLGNGYANLPIEKMAGLLLARISQSQAFENGNKRKALMSMLVFLETHGLKIKCDKNDMMTILHGLANKNKTEEDAIQFVMDNIIPTT